VKFYLVNSSNPAKTKKTHCLKQEINLLQIPHPAKAMFESPLPRHDAQSNARGMPRGKGEVLKLRFEWYIIYHQPTQISGNFNSCQGRTYSIWSWLAVLDVIPVSCWWLKC